MTSKLLPALLLALFVPAVLAQTPPGQAPAPATATKGACRTYDTSATAVTVAGALKVTMTVVGVFDPSSIKTTQRVNYEDSNGGRHSYTQVTTYASTEDVIAEVVRLKPPADVSTNPPGPSVGVIPPLTRWVSITASGAMVFTLTNSFDSQGRLTGSVNVMPAGQTTTRYTTWDPSGRPTAGTVQSPNQSSRLAMAYNDQARTSTTTITTGNIVAVGTQTYDVNGNARVYTQRSNTPGGLSTTTTTAGSSATICLGDTRAPAAPGLAPVGPSSNGTVTATINGRAWTATLGVRGSYQPQPPVVSVGGGDSRYLIGLAVTVNRGPGAYTAGEVDPQKLAQMTMKEFTDTMARNTAVATVFDSVTKGGWQADPSFGGGTITVTSVSSSGASGTFSLTLVPTPGTGATGTMTLNGSFNVRF